MALVRNTSEANNIINNGLELSADDEVVIWDQNHPTYAAHGSGMQYINPGAQPLSNPVADLRHAAAVRGAVLATTVVNAVAVARTFVYSLIAFQGDSNAAS